MSASMLRQMLEDAGALLKEHKYQEALDASRRVTQFDANNFQAFMCVGLANFNLQQWEDSEDAYRRAAALKPDMPAAWKNLVDLFDASAQLHKKLEPLEQLVTIFHRTNKVKACQKWIAEVATTATALKLFEKAFAAWHSLVVASSSNDATTQAICLHTTPNDELPSQQTIWLDIVEVLQRPGFALSDTASSPHLTLPAIAEQFFRAASTWSIDVNDATATARLDAAIAFFMRSSLDALKAAPAKTKTKAALLEALDAQALAILEWLPTAKIPCEYLLLRAEDAASPITPQRAAALAQSLESIYSKSPMVQFYVGVRSLDASDPERARAAIVDGLAYCASSSFVESALCIRAQVVLATLALDARDVESCLSRLQRVQALVQEKAHVLGCDAPRSDIYSLTKAQLMEATAREYAGDVDKALVAYQTLIDHADADDPSVAFQALVRVVELHLARNNVDATRNALDAFAFTDALSSDDAAVLVSLQGWVLFERDAVNDARALLERAVATIPGTRRTERAQALKRLAIVYWHVDGAARLDKAFCFTHLLQAAKLCATDTETFAWLGRWYDVVAVDAMRAEKCYLKALALAPANALAGESLSALYAQQQQPAASVALWEDMTREPVTAPTWALLRLAQHLVELDDERAVTQLHLVLRNDPLVARHWVALGHVYRHFGKLVSAHKSYLRAVELGDASACVLTELARIEGAMLLFDDALTHIEPLVASLSDTTAQAEVVVMLYAELLFKQAKYLCAEGLYGRSASNLQKASALLATLSATGVYRSVEGLKLIGDIHCFAFYLSPSDFVDAATEQSALPGKATPWVEFIANGRKAFEAAAAMLQSNTTTASAAVANTDAMRADVSYDLGLSCWYEAQALCSAYGVALSGFEHVAAPPTAQMLATIQQTQPELLSRVAALKRQAKTHFRDAVRANPALALGWNGLGVVSDHALMKQFAWIRAIGVASSDAAWANLGMLYVQHVASSAAAATTTASLAQNALIHLQGVNAANPSMWNGYGMLARREVSTAAQQKALEAFRCALEIGLDADALQGFASSALQQWSVTASVNGSHTSAASLLFAMRKVLERDPLDAGAWNALGVLQQRLGRSGDACASFAQAQALATTCPWTTQPEQRSGLAWNASVAALSVAEDETIAATNNAAVRDVINQAIAAVKTQQAAATSSSSGALLGVLDAQKLFYDADVEGSLTALASLLQSELTLNERDAVAVVALSIAGLAHTTDARVSQELVERVRSLSKHQLVTERLSNAQLHVVEMYDRATGHDVQSLHEIVRASDHAPTSTWPRLVFALVDFCDVDSARSFPPTKALLAPSGDDAKDNAYAKALAALLLESKASGSRSGANDAAARGATAAVHATRKLVRMVPWEPLAYVLAGAALLKQHALLPLSDAMSESASHCLDNAVLLLEHGVRVATATAASTSSHAIARTQLQWLLSICYVQLGDATRAAAIVADALESIASIQSTYPTHAQTFELLAARLQSTVDPIASAARFRAVLAQLVSPSSSTAALPLRTVSILCELGAVYEAAGLDDCALQVWKAVAFLSSGGSSGTEPTVGALFANLRLALVHGKKQNAKAAKKQIKSAAAFVSRPESTQATVVSFVESVLVNSG